MRKKIICFIMSIIFITGTMVGFDTNDVYAISQNDVVSQLNSLVSQYNGRTATSSQMYMGSQCKGFANWVFLQIFGVYIGPYPESANYKISNPNAQTLGIIEPGNLNVNTAKALLQKGVPGDYIQVQRSTARGRGPHSMILMGVNDNGIEVFDCNSDGKNTIKKQSISWASFDTANRAMSLYRANGYSPSSMSSSGFNFGTPVNLGESFSARIRNCASGKYLTNWNNSDVYLDSSRNEHFAKQIWKFRRNSDGSYKIITSVTDKAMDLDCAKNEDGANIKLYQNYATSAQSWFIYQRSDGSFLFKSALSETRVFDLASGSTDDGTNLQLYTSNNTEAQKFYIDKCNGTGNIGDDFSALILNRDCGKPITLREDDRLVLSTEMAENHARQLWHFTYNSDDGSYFIQSWYNQFYLDVVGGSDKGDGTPIGVWKENKDLSQRWFVIIADDGYRLKPACASGIMDVCSGSQQDGALIQLWTPNNTSAQNYAIYKLDRERDNISYHLISDSGSIDIGEKTGITVEGALYGVNYKLYIVSPDGSMEIVDLKTSNQYEFGAETKGIYKIYASVTSPVSYSIGSETDRCIKIAVGYDYETSKNLSTVYHGHLYQLVKKRQVSWGQAKDYCEEHHSYLAAVTDADENRQIAKLIQQNGEDAFIGGVRKNDTEFRWTNDSKEVFSYSNWDVGEPNNYNHGICQIRDPYGRYAEENYIVMRENGLWNDVMFFGANAFVMESNPKSITISPTGEKSWADDGEFNKNSIKVEVLFSDGSKRIVTDYTVEKRYTTEMEEELKISWNGLEEIITIAKNQHNHSYHAVVIAEATCQSTGVKKYTCSICGNSYTEAIPKKNHTAVTDQAIAATCTLEGKTQGSHCKDCGAVIKPQQTIPKTEHIWNNGEITVQATAAADGIRTYTCISCGEIKTEKIPAFGQTGNQEDSKDDADSDQEDHTDSKGENEGSTNNTDLICDLEVGDEIEDNTGTAEYEVISVSGSDICVEYAESIDEKARVIKIPDTIKTEDGIVCKVTAISKGAFKNNRKIKKVLIGNHITIIGAKALYGCRNLTSVQLGESVTVIGNRAFYGCRKLKKLNVKTELLSSSGLHKKAFQGIPEKTIVQVPKNMKKSYEKLLCQKGLSSKNKIR